MSERVWQAGKAYREIVYETSDGIAKITINRPERRNAFTPLTVNELYDAFTVARDDASIGVIILTGMNHGGRHEDEAFCSGGDQKIRGNGGYVGATVPGIWPPLWARRRRAKSGTSAASTPRPRRWRWAW